MTRLGLVPAAWDAALAGAMVKVLGPATTREIARTSMLESMRGGLLGALAMGVVNLFGRKPGRFFRWANRAWCHVTIGCGTIDLEAEEGSRVTLLLHGMAPTLATPEYLTFIAGTLESIFDFCQVSGEVQVSPRMDGARFVATWSSGIVERPA